MGIRMVHLFPLGDRAAFSHVLTKLTHFSGIDVLCSHDEFFDSRSHKSGHQLA